MIVTTKRQKGPNLPSKRPLSSVYEGVKYAAKAYGIYEDIKQYDPGFYYERYAKKYTYKPRKRITGYAFQTQGFLRKKNYASTYRFKQKCDKPHWSGNYYNSKSNTCIN